MRKTQCDEDRCVKEKTLRANSTAASDFLWEENSRLQEQQQRCHKQPSCTDAFYYHMRKTQCDEDSYVKESTPLANSTPASDFLLQENRRLQEHQPQCRKQPSNPQRSHRRIRWRTLCKRPFSVSEFLAVFVRWVVDGIGS